MMPSNHLLSLAAGTLPEATPPEVVSAAASAGFDASGVWFDPETWEKAVAESVRQRLAGSGLIALDIEVARLGREGDLATARAMIDAGAEVGARFALCIGMHPDIGRVAGQFALVCEQAEAVGIRPVMEFMRFTTVRSLPEALAVVRQAGHPAGGVLVDALHLARCGHSPADLADVEDRLLPYLQLCDAAPQAPAEEDLLTEALDGRLLPGEGALPLDELLSAAPRAVPLSVELRSRALRSGYRDFTERARVVARSSRDFLRARSA